MAAKKSLNAHCRLWPPALAALLLFVASHRGAAADGDDLVPVPIPITLDSIHTKETVNKEATPVDIQPVPNRSHLSGGDLQAISVIVTFDGSVSDAELESISGGQVIHRFDKVFNGASIVLESERVPALAALSGVTGIYLDELRQVNTEASPEFIGAPYLWQNHPGVASTAGEGVIVAIIDSGVWPEHPSFSDPDPFGVPYTPPAIAPGTNGFGGGGPRSTCDFGNTAANPNDSPFTCNNKLIGAYAFIDTYKAIMGQLPTEFASARDDDGHGTHTASTAAGNGGVAATLLGLPRGVVSGVAPRAHLIAYKVCGIEGCFQSDSVAAVEQAILDGVDVINFSISGGENPYMDIVEHAFAIAYQNGIFVAAAAGNAGPMPDTVSHRGPWTTTVAASTSNRHFISTITLTSSTAAPLIVTGASVTAGISTPTPVALAGGDGQCAATMPAVTPGAIVVCDRGGFDRVLKSFNAMNAGASAIFLRNLGLQGLSTDNFYIPGVHLEFDTGQQLYDYVSTNSDVLATFTTGIATEVQGDVMAPFSSRGGPGQTLGVNKPDITAPGVQILAGHTPLGATQGPGGSGPYGELFQAIQGTSMSSPHIAGSAALLKAAKPAWGPGQIKSALMMTAVGGLVKEDGITPADPFDFGAGRVQLAKIEQTAATISATYDDFIAYEHDLWNANYPSLYIPTMPGQITVSRTLQNETNKNVNWKLSVYRYSDDFTVTVPKRVRLDANDDERFNIAIDARNVPLGEARHAILFFTYRDQILRFPISFVRQQPNVLLDQTCDPPEFLKRETTTCTLILANQSFSDAHVSLVDLLPWQLKLVNGTVAGATQVTHRKLTFAGTLAGAAPPLYDAAVDPLASPFGYVALSTFASSLTVTASDESITNFDVPAFTFAGNSYTRIGIVSNGYLVLGGGTEADVDFVNTNLPDPAVPNNILAPFWTDLNPSNGGRILINVLTNGIDSWIVVEWESVPNYSDGATNTFQVWIQYTGSGDISYTYGPDISHGNGGSLTVGAENEMGSSGRAVYYNGLGAAPAPTLPNGSYAVLVFSTPGAPGETHNITFTAVGRRRGEWQNCAELRGDIFFGINTACVNGRVH